ncbi:MAG: NTP transferase domain-containing protein [Phycisphaeraceae bacterium]|nr:NTP transferase domain-containing protein [Phycisphaeraceae bacterium]
MSVSEQPAVIINARLSSTRLPRKVLRPIHGQEMLLHQIDRIKLCQNVGPIIIATSDREDDEDIATLCKREGLNCFRGSLDDVAGRMLGAATFVEASAFIRLSGDSPFLDPSLVDTLSNIFQAAQCDLATNIQLRTFPKGQSVEVISVEALSAAHKDMNALEREHVTPYFYRNENHYKIVNLTSGKDFGDIQLSVDTPEEFEMADRLFSQFLNPLAVTGWEEITKLYLDLKPND